MKKVIHIIGTRPNFIKAAPVIKSLNNSYNIENIVLHTGQHYDYNMSGTFFKDLGISQPDINLGLGGGTHATQTANIMIGCERVFSEVRPDMVIVYGDVNSCVAATIVASKMHLEDNEIDKILVIHIESGLRSNDRSMPEELNRIVTDSLSDYLFVTCEDAIDNLVKEGIPKEKYFFVGNPMIDSLVEFEDKFDTSDVLNEYDLKIKEYALITLHRPFTVDDKSRLMEMMDSLVEVSEDIKCIFPIHPRTRNALVKIDLYNFYKSRILMTEPLGYIDFMCLQKNAKFVITDSGGVQEESSYFNVPCLTMRDNTERPITINDGTNELIGTDYMKILKRIKSINYNKKTNIKLWDGRSSDRIVKILKEKLNDR
ncbi:UDP-N-acetylglucosamine 2-epimerase (non-hydrolyzing) [Candidatus Pacearchaeota archaeon]|jgi:UDP-N-acetylglucosamine 2-epimerase (non-hydrolysing)|nr:UDP-N-acetylglucosamine 2-epimerase (non-hydrolyzing) [Candidatus Pacearchaeota archaeon]